MFFEKREGLMSLNVQTTFQIGQAQRLHTLKNLADADEGGAGRKLKDARGRGKFGKTRRLVPDGPACRIYGAMVVKKVTGNLHIVSSHNSFVPQDAANHL